MTNEELKSSISEILPSSAYDETGEFLAVLIDASELSALMEKLYEKSKLDFNYLFCLTCIDWKDHLMMVYHLNSKLHGHSLVVKAKISDINNPEIKTVTELWKGAELLEREVFDLFGVKFIGHPDLRRLLLDESWIGYPLRKNYTDENMIKL